MSETTAHELHRYLHEHIPLSRAMQVAAVSVTTESVLLSAPLAPNINHRETVFGGSASALAILAAWSLLHVRLRAEGLPSRLVIQRNTMEYAQPVQGEFFARSALQQPSQWPQFLRMLQRKGRARAGAVSVLEHRGVEVGRLVGEFVALGAGPSSRLA